MIEEGLGVYTPAMLKYNQDGLIPAIVQDEKTGEILMLAYMNQESLKKTLETGRAWFFSRSRQKLWMKGETSGHYQIVKAVHTDCDQDAVLLIVEQQGPGACHEGYRSCFHYDVVEGESLVDPSCQEGRRRGGTDEPSHQSPLDDSTTQVLPQANTVRTFDPQVVYGAGAGKILDELYQVILDRKHHPNQNSYTCYLFEKGIDKILKKVGEEAAEVIIAAKNPGIDELIYEVADLIYHLLVLLAEKKVAPAEVFAELESRRK